MFCSVPFHCLHSPPLFYSIPFYSFLFKRFRNFDSVNYRLLHTLFSSEVKLFWHKAKRQLPWLNSCYGRDQDKLGKCQWKKSRIQSFNLYRYMYFQNKFAQCNWKTRSQKSNTIWQTGNNQPTSKWSNQETSCRQFFKQRFNVSMN